MLESPFQPVEEATEEPKPIRPAIEIVEANDAYGKFVIEPLERGFGPTLGNPLRRVLLNSIPGTAVTWVRIEDVLHEYSAIPGVKEEVMELLLNIKGLHIRSVTGRPGKMRLEVKGEGEVCAGDIATSADFEIINPELHLASLSTSEAALSLDAACHTDHEPPACGPYEVCRSEDGVARCVPSDAGALFELPPSVDRRCDGR